MTENPESQHVSVLLNEVCDAFSSQELSCFIDGTLGAGGHARAILSQHPELKRYVGIDQDAQARSIAAERLSAWSDRLEIIPGNFSDMAGYCKERQIQDVDGILLDLGVSSMQLDGAERGFSFREEGPLDMRMDQSQSLTAEQVVMDFTEQQLGRIFRDYGEEKCWRQAARQIVKSRQESPIRSTRDLAEVLTPVLPSAEARRRKGQSHPLTRIYQALRIAVNSELEVLHQVLPQAIELLRPGGRLAVITFHSLEDRIVKNFFRDSASDKYDTSGVGGVFLDKIPLVTLVTRKGIVPSETELEVNPRARSARLRVVEKC